METAGNLRNNCDYESNRGTYTKAPDEPRRNGSRATDLITATAPSSPFRGLVGTSGLMRRLFHRIESIAATRSNVLIVGESGTGKELVAKAIHECADEQKPFVPFNCAAITRELIESELFGHRRGAFTGATAEHRGLLRAAEGGTALLDEVTEMSADVQAKLLRAIQERTVRPIGYTYEIPFDVRIIASTNRDPVEAVRVGQLRADLYYRLEAHVLEIAPLRDRPDDVAPLAYHFLSLLNERNQSGRSVKEIDRDALAALEAHNWPGNVRELGNTIESAFTFGVASVITLDDLPIRIVNGWRTRSEAMKSSRQSSSEVAELPMRSEDRGTYAEFERESIARALRQAHGNKVRAARILKISRKKLYNRISRYALNTEECRSCGRATGSMAGRR